MIDHISHDQNDIIDIEDWLDDLPTVKAAIKAEQEEKERLHQQRNSTGTDASECDHECAELSDEPALDLESAGQPVPVPVVPSDEATTNCEPVGSEAEVPEGGVSVAVDDALDAPEEDRKPVSNQLISFPVSAALQKSPSAPTARADTQSIPDGYALFSDGIYKLPAEDVGELIHICSPLQFVASFSDCNGGGWGRLALVTDPDGRSHEVRVSMSDLTCQPGRVISDLVGRGLILSADKKSKDRLLALLKAWKPSETLVAADRTGWTDEDCTSFLAGETAIGSRQMLAPMTGKLYSSAGTAQDWRENVGMLCRDNPMMILAVSLAFTGPLLLPLGLHGGGLHFRGTSSSGKTTLLTLAASVWGSRDLISQWRATSNGLEAIAASRNDMLLPLDEIAEIRPRDLHEGIYMLANGTGKTRMTTDAVLADTARWRLALISSGEISIDEKLREGRLTAMDGHGVRLLDIEADSRSHGVFDVLHGEKDAAAFADQVRRVSRRFHGTAGPEFVRQLISRRTLTRVDGHDTTIRTSADTWLDALPDKADGPTMRAARRFALIGHCGSLATELNLTGWSNGSAINVAKEAFFNWHDNRYSDRIEAANVAVAPLKLFLNDNLTSLTPINGSQVASSAQLGWRDATRVYLPPQTWSSIYPGPSGAAAATALIDAKILVAGDDKRPMRKASRAIPGRPRLYTVNIDRVMALRAS